MAQPKMVLCPTCRTPIFDKDYYTHAQACQAKKAAEVQR